VAKKQQKPKGLISFRIDPAVEKRLKVEAEARERSVSWLIEFYVKAGLGLAKVPRRQSAQESAVA
jgi:Ribbon-helix-helix protein, copG family.